MYMSTLWVTSNYYPCRYGSGDGGANVFASNEVVNAKMKNIAEKLNLRLHTVGDVKMALCGDIEVHKNEDSYYVLGK